MKDPRRGRNRDGDAVKHALDRRRIRKKGIRGTADPLPDPVEAAPEKPPGGPGP